MRAIKENLVGLLRFLLILTGLLLPFKPKPQPMSGPTPVNPGDSKYDTLVGLSEPLLPTEPLFCPKCHVLAANLRRTKGGIQIIQNNKVLVTVGGNITVSNGGKIKTGFPIRCPNGHIVGVE